MGLDFEANVDSFLYLITFLAIDINASDIKALYRRSQALERLGKLDQAFKDVQRCATIEPRNKNFQETLRRLGANIQEKVKAFATAPNTWQCTQSFACSCIEADDAPLYSRASISAECRW